VRVPVYLYLLTPHARPRGGVRVPVYLYLLTACTPPQEYIKRNPGPNPDKKIIFAGHATHNESAFLQELIVREMLEESKSMIIDGSLSNAEWYR